MFEAIRIVNDNLIIKNGSILVELAILYFLDTFVDATI